jgi:hypothetical protein
VIHIFGISEPQHTLNPKKKGSSSNGVGSSTGWRAFANSRRNCVGSGRSFAWVVSVSNEQL